MRNRPGRPAAEEPGGIVRFLARLRASVPMADRVREDGLPPRSAIAVFLGDSITAGWREWGVLDPETAYPALWAQGVRRRYGIAALSVINAGLGGSNTEDGLRRLERDVLQHRPDLTVVCYGLNDAGSEEAGLDPFVRRLGELIRRIREAGSACVYLTPNPMHAPGIRDEDRYADHWRRAAAWAGAYIEAGRDAAARAGAAVADGYGRWLALLEEGRDPRSLLSNGLHHPNDAGHRVLADALLEATFRGRGG